MNCRQEFILMAWAKTISVDHDPDLIKEVTIKNIAYEKPHSNPLSKLLAQGLATLEGDKWSRHRKIINPDSHQDN
jgi:hypothetical protein